MCSAWGLVKGGKAERMVRPRASFVLTWSDVTNENIRSQIGEKCLDGTSPYREKNKGVEGGRGTAITNREKKKCKRVTKAHMDRLIARNKRKSDSSSSGFLVWAKTSCLVGHVTNHLF